MNVASLLTDINNENNTQEELLNALSDALRGKAGAQNSSDEFELIKEITFTEDAQSWEINTDKNGLPFELKEFYVLVDHPKSETAVSGSYGFARVNGINTKAYTNVPLFPSSSYYKKAFWNWKYIGDGDTIEQFGSRENVFVITSNNTCFTEINDAPSQYASSVGFTYGGVNIVATNGSVVRLFGKRK